MPGPIKVEPKVMTWVGGKVNNPKWHSNAFGYVQSCKNHQMIEKIVGTGQVLVYWQIKGYK